MPYCWGASDSTAALVSAGNAIAIPAPALEICGDRWTLLIVHAIATGTTRFGRLHRTLAISRTVLTRRLQRLLDEGIVERHEYHPHNGWAEYRLTARGLALYPAIAALIEFANGHTPGSEQ